MATPRKIRELMEAAEMEAVFTMITQGFCNQLSLEQLGADGADEVLLAQAQAKVTERLRPAVFAMIEGVIGPEFSDEELDQLIRFHRLPVSQKMRALIPTVQKESVNLLTDGRINIDNIIKEVLAELTK